MLLFEVLKSGYQGIAKYHKNSETPIKASKNISFKWKKNGIIMRFQKENLC